MASIYENSQIEGTPDAFQQGAVLAEIARVFNNKREACGLDRVDWKTVGSKLFKSDSAPTAGPVIADLDTDVSVMEPDVVSYLFFGLELVIPQTMNEKFTSGGAVYQWVEYGTDNPLTPSDSWYEQNYAIVNAKEPINWGTYLTEIILAVNSMKELRTIDKATLEQTEEEVKYFRSRPQGTTGQTEGPGGLSWSPWDQHFHPFSSLPERPDLESIVWHLPYTSSPYQETSEWPGGTAPVHGIGYQFSRLVRYSIRSSKWSGGPFLGGGGEGTHERSGVLRINADASGVYRLLVKITVNKITNARTAGVTFNCTVGSWSQNSVDSVSSETTYQVNVNVTAPYTDIPYSISFMKPSFTAIMDGWQDISGHSISPIFFEHGGNIPKKLYDCPSPCRDIHISGNAPPDDPIDLDNMWPDGYFHGLSGWPVIHGYKDLGIHSGKLWDPNVMDFYWITPGDYKVEGEATSAENYQAVYGAFMNATFRLDTGLPL